MKCEKCFFCVRIGKGIYADYPVKYCKYHKRYMTPFVFTQDNGGTMRRLDFNKMSDCKIWRDVGCNIHPSRVAKAKRDFIKKMEEKIMSKNWTVYADRVNELLKDRKMTQRELAEMVGCTEVSMSRYLSCQRVPKGPVIARTAKALHVPCDYLLGLVDEL